MQELKAVKTERKKRMLYTPKHHIPVGEVVRTKDGKCALRIKHTDSRNQHKTDDIPFDYLIAQAIEVSINKKSS